MDAKKLDVINSLNHDTLRDILKDIMLNYCSPSFGSMAKHDIDLMIFSSMISLGILDKNPSIYEVMRELKVTRAKARNLIYENQLRNIKSEHELEHDLREILKCPLLSNQSSYVCIEIDNPCLIDYIRNELKKLGYITDGSFNPEMVKMSPEAFSDLYFKVLSDYSQKELDKKLVSLGIKEDTSFKAIFPHLIKGVIKTAATTAFGKIGDDITDCCFDYIGDIIKENKTDINKYFESALKK